MTVYGTEMVSWVATRYRLMLLAYDPFAIGHGSEPTPTAYVQLPWAPEPEVLGLVGPRVALVSPGLLLLLLDVGAVMLAGAVMGEKTGAPEGDRRALTPARARTSSAHRMAAFMLAHDWLSREERECSADADSFPATPRIRT